MILRKRSQNKYAQNSRICKEYELTKLQSDRVMVASIDADSPLQLLDKEERQELKAFQDQVIDILVVLDSTMDTITFMIEKYEQFCHDIKTSSADLADNQPDPILLALRENQQVSDISKKKVEASNTKVQGTISLVRPYEFYNLIATTNSMIKLSDLLNLGSGSSLQRLAEEARKENIAMRGLTEKGTRDAAAVKVLTVITLVYLPATVVSVSGPVWME